MPPHPSTEPAPGLPIWVIYDHPTDWPDHYVARLWIGERPTGDMVLTFDLDLMREHLASRGFVRFDRVPEDDAKIVETWL